MDRIDVFVMHVLYVKLGLVTYLESVSGINVPPYAVFVVNAVHIIALKLEFLRFEAIHIIVAAHKTFGHVYVDSSYYVHRVVVGLDPLGTVQSYGLDIGDVGIVAVGVKRRPATIGEQVGEIAEPRVRASAERYTERLIELTVSARIASSVDEPTAVNIHSIQIDSEYIAFDISPRLKIHFLAIHVKNQMAGIIDFTSLEIFD